MSLQRLLYPRSVAIVGASDKIGPGFNAWKALEHVGFEGAVHLVNPNKPELFGRKTVPTLLDIEGDVDAVFVAVKAESVLEIAQQAVARRAGGLAILSSGFGDAGEEGRRLQEQLSTYARANDLAACGPDCRGHLNFAGRTALFGTSLPDAVPRSGIAAIVQSGSIGIALLNSARGLGLSHLITAGNEAVTTTADFLEPLIEDAQVRTIIVFAEQIRQPARFMAMTRRAAEAGKPVIVLKSGRSERGQAAVMAHTGAVAGSVEACDAALAAAGAIQVFSLDELLETAAVASGIRTRPTARKIGALSISGGEIALGLDAAEEYGVQFAPLGAAEAKIGPLMPAFSHLSNPLDLTWAGLYDPKVAEGCAKAMGDEADVGALVLMQDAPTGLGAQQANRYATLLSAVAKGAEAAGKPLVAITNLSDQPHPELARAAREAQVPYLRGTREGMAAIGRYAAWASRAALPVAAAGKAAERDPAQVLLHSFKGAHPPAEHEARRIMASYGIAGPVERFVAGVEDAARAAADIGFPVVLKGVVPGMLHKTEAGLVKLRLANADAVRQAAQDMQSRQGKSLAGFLVQAMAAPVAEILVGARVDPEFGPLVVVGAGGVNVELYKDVAVRIAPLGEDEALEALLSTRVARLLQGWRGAPPADCRAVARTVAAVSRFIADFSGEVREVELNPLAVFAEGKGCAALDCVIVPGDAR